MFPPGPGDCGSGCNFFRRFGGCSYCNEHVTLESALEMESIKALKFLCCCLGTGVWLKRDGGSQRR